MSNQKQGQEQKPMDFSVENNPLNQIRRTIAVVSGKGGVGKSMVTALLATYLQRTGNYRVGILDADITGPSIPKLFGAGSYKPEATEAGIFPVRSHSNIQIMSINLLLDEPESPVVWRGPILANTVKQFWTDVVWGDLDFMFLDMPPGTGDVPLTVFQSLPLDGIILVTSPQDLVSMIVKKAVNMARMMNIPIVGLVENMSYAICPGCGESIRLFGESKIEAIAAKWDIPYLGSLPIDPDLARLCDEGNIEKIHKPYLTEAIAALEKIPARGESRQDEPEVVAANESDSTDTVCKVAIAAEKDAVCDHFGYCEGFAIYTTENGKITGQEFVENPGHKPGVLPNMLADKAVNVIIAGGMGGGAVEIFNNKGIEVITGAKGAIEQAINEFLAGRLKSSGSVCNDHHLHSEEG